LSGPFFRFILVGLALAFAPSAWALHDVAPTSVRLERGDYAARFYLPTAAHSVRALVVLGSGDGGWSYWEERVAQHLAKRHVAVVGVDFQLYAASAYTADILRADFRQLITELRQRVPGTEATPVLYGGWSMGAEQALPAASVLAERTPGLRGLLLISPGARGRYGLSLRDRLGLAPTGADTFALREHAPGCADLRLAVFHAGLDLLDDLQWFHGVPLELRRWDTARTFHDFAGASDEFLDQLDEAVKWCLAVPEKAQSAPPAEVAP
jgi:phosphatidylglycerol lysyltransferase